MRLLVTGGAGFIGSAVVRRAIAQDHAVCVVDKLTYAANLENLAPVSGHAQFRLATLDICDRAGVSAVLGEFKPDAILHLAAESHVDRSIDGPAPFIETNIVGTYRLLEAARDYWLTLTGPARESFKFLHISTDEVFGSLGEEGRFCETSPYDPRSPYSASKAASDHLARAWHHTFGLPVIVTNCSNNYGPYHFPEKLVPVVILSALEGRSIPVYGEGANIRDWLYVDDHAAALLLVASRGSAGETYNIGGNNECRNIDLVRAICRAVDQRRPASRSSEELITFVKDRPGHDFRYAIDASKIMRELGWRPSTALNDGLIKTVDWFLENEAWWQKLRARGHGATRLGLTGAPGK